LGKHKDGKYYISSVDICNYNNNSHYLIDSDDKFEDLVQRNKEIVSKDCSDWESWRDWTLNYFLWSGKKKQKTRTRRKRIKNRPTTKANIEFKRYQGYRLFFI